MIIDRKELMRFRKKYPDRRFVLLPENKVRIETPTQTITDEEIKEHLKRAELKNRL